MSLTLYASGGNENSLKQIQVMLPRNISRRAESWADANFACTLCRYASEDGPTKELLGDPSTCTSEELAARIDDLSPSRRLRCIISLILRGFESPEEKKRVMSLPESLVWDIMEELLESLENSKSCEGCVGREMNLRRMMVALSRSAKILPRSLSLHGVTLSTKDPINGGGYADIFRATYQGQAVALKRLRTFTNAPPSEKQKAAFRREALVSWFLDHPNVQVFLGIDEDAFSSQGLLCIVTPWQKNGNIMDCLRRLKEIGVPLLVDEWIRGILCGLCFLHDGDIIHGDLRGGNILIDNHYHPKLADFGLSMLAGSGSMTMGSHSGPRGTLRFMAPELFIDENPALSLKSDIYAFGCICIELHTLRPPFPDKNDAQIIVLKNSGIKPSRPSQATNSLKDFWIHIEQCWDPKPFSRPSAHQLVKTLPLQYSSFSTLDLKTFSHTEWTPSHKSISSPSITQTIDPCILHFLDLDLAHSKSSAEIAECLLDLGCPSEIIELAHTVSVSIESYPIKDQLKDQPTIDRDHKKEYLKNTDNIFDSWLQAQSTRSIPQSTMSLHNLGIRLAKTKLYSDAIDAFQGAISLCQSIGSVNIDTNTSKVAFLILSLHWLSLCYSKLNDFFNAIKYTLDIMSLQESLIQINPEYNRAPLAISLYQISQYYNSLNDFQNAIKYSSQAVILQQEIAESGSEQHISRLATFCYQLSLYYSSIEDYTKAVKYGIDAINIQESLAQSKPNLYNTELARFLHSLFRYNRNLELFDIAKKYGLRAFQIYHILSNQKSREYDLQIAQLQDELLEISFTSSDIQPIL